MVWQQWVLAIYFSFLVAAFFVKLTLDKEQGERTRSAINILIYIATLALAVSI